MGGENKDQHKGKMPVDEELINDILDASYDGIVISDHAGKILYAGKALERITGLNPHLMIGRTLGELVERNVLDKNSVTFRTLDSHKQASSLLRLPQKKSLVLSTSTPCFDSSGKKLKYIITNVRNIIELEALKAEFEAKKELFGEHFKLDSAYRSKLLADLNEHGIKELIIRDNKSIEILETLISMQEFELNYLITGETGTGKGLFAKIIHHLSGRQNQPFIEVNCSAIPIHLLESELFGYKDGAFTGASKGGQVGLLEMANKGSIFLDEIGAMPLEIQAKILKFLDDKKIKRLGSSKTVGVDVQVIAATNKDISKAIEDGSFRKDLFFRLNEIAIEIPPLRERPEDIAYMTDFFMEKYNRDFSKQISISETARNYLASYQFPGNVREFKNILKRLILMTKGPEVEIKDVSKAIMAVPEDEKGDLSVEDTREEPELRAAMWSYEKEIVKKAYEKYRSTYAAAEALGMHQSTFYRRAKKYGVL